MKKQLLLSIALIFILSVVQSQVKVINPLCENLENPGSLDTKSPRFSWQLQSDKRNILQTAYEIRVSDSKESLSKGKNIVWSSGKVVSDESVHVAYNGKPIESGKKYFWQVRVWDQSEKASAWSTPAWWQMGLLNAADWKAKWIEAGFAEDSIVRPSPLFRRQFNTSKKIKSATLYITAQGMYEAWLNGKRVGNDYLTPGWTSYKNRLQYQQYDVTNMLGAGKNALGVVLGSGWYRGFIGFSGQQNFYGKKLALLCQLAIEYTDNSQELILSDDSWKSATGSIISSEIYNGETIDARKEKTGWSSPTFNDADWSAVKIRSGNFPPLIATYNEPVRKKETFKALNIIKTPKGEQVIDFGQNLVGWVQIKASGKAGDKITLYHAEVLDKAGNFYTDNLRAAKQTNTYILKGDGEEFFEPHFTFQGFRYIKIEGYPGEIKPENFTAVALYSDMKPTGTFTSSNPLLNQLQHNIQWGQKGNFLDVPTDCPQRDERLGWTGDAQAFARTATFNMQVNNFFSKWMKDLAADQQPNGSVPFVVPNVLGAGAGAACGWADAATIIPWTMYQAYGDKRILEDQYPSMKAWLGYIESVSKNDLWNTGFHFGDWLFYTMGDDNAGNAAVTDRYLIAQCFYAYSTQLLINTANVLGKPEDVKKYEALLKRVKDAFLKEYVSPNGRLTSNTQTAYVLALQFDMLPETMRAQAADRLVANIKQYGTHLTTGFLGTPYLCHVLSRFGHTDIAYQLLLQETYPSWLYPVKMGATTIWERWNGIKPDGSFEVPSMNSFNHYAYGAIGDWMYRVVAGLDTDIEGPGYKRIVINPHIGGNLTHAAASLETYYGKVSSAWKMTGENLEMTITIPANTKATVHIPTTSASSVKEMDKLISSIQDIKILKSNNDEVVVELGSGDYRFQSLFAKKP